MATRGARDNKVLNAKHTEILRGLLKQPENKLCAECKKNDPRWASTNIGCFVCIRCSGIHRSMGVHISRIKSIDLDTWTPEQVANVQRWGNYRANAYWEAHLRPGHIPPDHKIESFIRSKYESKRWAMEGPVPDPDTLGPPEEDTSNNKNDNTNSTGTGAGGLTSQSSLLPPPPSTTSTTTTTSSSLVKPQRPSRAMDNFLDGPLAPTETLPSLTTPSNTVSATTSGTPVGSGSGARVGGAGAGGGGGGLFDLDFSPQATSQASIATQPSARQDVKKDILSLFSSAAPPVQTSVASSVWGGGGSGGVGATSGGGGGGATWGGGGVVGIGSTTTNVSTSGMGQTSHFSTGSTAVSDDLFGAFSSAGSTFNNSNSQLNPHGATSGGSGQDVFSDIWK